MAVILDGDTLAADLRLELATRAADSAFVRAGGRPGLTTILVGEDRASRAYVTRKHDDCAQLGFAARSIELPSDTSEAAVQAAVRQENDDPSCHGVLVQFPLPPHLDPAIFRAAVRVDKDVDGLHPVNLGHLLTGEYGLRPCTPQGILLLLRHYGVPLAGRRVAIVGRGLLVGRPLAVMAAQPGIDAVPTLLHRGASNMAEILRESDVIVAAAGVPDLVTAAMVKPGAAVVGVGISYRDGAMVSDIADDVATLAGHVTPRHGSVGALTRAMLMRNLLEAALASA